MSILFWMAPAFELAGWTHLHGVEKWFLFLEFFELGYPLLPSFDLVISCLSIVSNWIRHDELMFLNFACSESLVSFRVVISRA